MRRGTRCGTSAEFFLDVRYTRAYKGRAQSARGKLKAVQKGVHTMPVVHDPEHAETRVIHDLLDFTGTDVLEVGCGNGRLTWRYADRTRSVLALDPDTA